MTPLSDLVGVWEFSRTTPHGRRTSVAHAALDGDYLCIEVATYDRLQTLVVRVDALLAGRFELSASGEHAQGRLDGCVTFEVIDDDLLEGRPDAFPAADIWTLRRTMDAELPADRRS